MNRNSKTGKLRPLDERKQERTSQSQQNANQRNGRSGRGYRQQTFAEFPGAAARAQSEQPITRGAEPKPTVPTFHCGRNATERLFQIRQLISDGKYPNCVSLAQDFEVSVKTLKRDLQWMRIHWDLPIAFDLKKNGYFFAEPVDQLPAVPSMTEAEIFSLLVAHKAIEQYHGTPFHKPLAMAFKRLTGQLDQQVRYSLHDLEGTLSFRPFAPEAMDMARFEAVTLAVQNRRALRFAYRKPGDTRAAQRHVHPYHLTCNDNRWYLIAFDVDRKDYRNFVLGRIEGSAQVGERFVKRRDFNMDQRLRGSLAMMSGDGDFEILIEFDAWATDIMRGRLWHSSQEITELAGGGSRMRLRLSALEEIERWVLSWGTHANVTAPQELIERVAAIARTVAHRYSTPDISKAA